MNADQYKTQLNLRAKSGLRADLRAKSWVQKVESIARMNAVTARARAAMAKAKSISAKDKLAGQNAK